MMSSWPEMRGANFGAEYGFCDRPHIGGSEEAYAESRKEAGEPVMESWTGPGMELLSIL